MVTRVVRFGSIALGLALVGCVEEDPCVVAAEVAPTLAVGIGDPEGFGTPLTGDEVATPDWGMQGGRHLYLSVRTTGFSPGDARALGQDQQVPVFEAVLTDTATGEVLAEQWWGWDAMTGDPTAAELALGEFFLPDRDGVEGGEPVTLEVTATDACGTRLVEEVGLTLEW